MIDRMKKRAAAKAVLTFCQDDCRAYIGYFECEREPAGISELLFRALERRALTCGCTKLTGPVNASFWLGYRLKADHFGEPSSGEPYILPYYQELFQNAGFRVRDTYKSNRFQKIDSQFDDPKFAARLEEKRRAGYEIRSPKYREFDGALKEC